MAGFADMFSGIGLGGLGGGLMGMITAVMIGLLGLTLVGGVLWYFYNRKQWNLKVEFNLPRAIKYLGDGKRLDINDVQGAMDGEWGKGSYNAKRGVVFLKRKGKKKIAMKPFNINKYLKSGNILTVVQVGSEEYEPVMPESFTMYVDDSGKQMALLNLTADKSANKPWKVGFERESKNAFSIANLFQQYQTPIMIGLVIMLWGIQFYVLYNKIAR